MTILALSKLKEFVDDKINVTQTLTLVLGGGKTLWEKKENAGYQHFLLFAQSFKKAQGRKKSGLCDKGLQSLI